MTTYTNIAKPSGDTYTNINTMGKEQYDQNIAYDDSNTFYDGVSGNLYTNITKPSATTYQNITKPT